MRRDDWPQVVPKPHAYANFRTEHALRPKPLTWAQRREGNDQEHLALIRRMACSVCPERDGTEAHHLKSGPARTERGIGLKATDRWAVPLCRAHHDDLERLASIHEPQWFDDYGYCTPHLVALRYWRETRNLKPAHRDEALRRLLRIQDGFKREAIQIIGRRIRARRA